MRHLYVLCAATLLTTGCPTRDKNPSNTGGATGTAGAGGAGGASAAMNGGQGGAAGPDGSAGEGGGLQAPLPMVAITSPTTTVYTHATVSITIATSQPTANTITLVATGPNGSQNIGTITAPQTSFGWNTAAVGEGTYSVMAQLTNGASTMMSDSLTVVVDRTPPQVVVSSLVPAPGAANVVAAAPIQVSFSEPIVAGTVTPAAIPIGTSTGSTLPTTVTLSPDAKTATIKINSTRGISLDQAFTGSFTNAITDLAGNSLLPPPTWSWQVPSWLKYAPIPSGGNGSVLLAVTSQGQPVVAYNLCTAGPYGTCISVVHVAVSDGEAWNDLGPAATGVSASNCALFLDAKNNPTVVSGTAPPNGTPQIVFSTWNGTAWVQTTYPAIDITPAQGSAVDSFAVALDGMGRPILAYRADVYTPTPSTNIYVAAWTGTAWDLSYGAIDNQRSSTFDVVLGAAGAPIVTVVAADGTSSVYLWSGTAWSLAAGAPSLNASATVDATGNPVMLTSALASWVPVHRTAGTWLSLVSTPVPTGANPSSPTLTSDATGLPVVAWCSTGSSPTGIGLARWTGTAWDSRPGFASGGGTPNNSPPQLVIDARNDIWLGWTEGTTVNVWMSNY